ncbi:hypothetical protein NDU88_008493 [Pleurodeles waltl]|uniref:Uncharacterized protein n=1 Tax=Pleurodeles waltl TaxID=8319 RepID=A0AAV7P577_PLEWA|nr:hypothetical protein NDU88_008493 [Pleurodeles waltl]
MGANVLGANRSLRCLDGKKTRPCIAWTSKKNASPRLPLSITDKHREKQSGEEGRRRGGGTAAETHPSRGPRKLPGAAEPSAGVLDQLVQLLLI